MAAIGVTLWLCCWAKSQYCPLLFLHTILFLGGIVCEGIEKKSGRQGKKDCWTDYLNTQK